MKPKQAMARIRAFEEAKATATQKLAAIRGSIDALTAERAAKVIGITPDAVRKAIRDGRLAAFQVTAGSAYYIDPKAAARYRDEVKPRGKGAKR